jgi:RNA polymerase sigma-70 factor, ECF subfamily
VTEPPYIADSLDQDAASAAGPDPEFVQLFTRSQRSLYLFILSQVPNSVDAEEILQETNLVIWRKMDRFQPGTSFPAWSSQIALLEVLKFRERRQRDRLRFSDEFVERVAEEAKVATDRLEERQRALVHCLGKLRKDDRELLEQRYAPGTNGLGLAERLGRPVNSVYQSLGRIRRALIECVNRRLAAEAGQ